MHKVNHCIICGNKKTVKSKTKLSDFIIYYLFNGIRPDCEIIYCPECGYRGSDIRFDEDELKRLYWDYRGEYYNFVRNHIEPNYAEISEIIDVVDIDFRKNYMRNFFYKFVNYNQIKTVLDYGGHKDHILEEFAHANCLVYNISKHNKVNVDSIGKVDFVMITHVLEHASYPDRLLQHIRTMCKDNTILYAEVPLCENWEDGKGVISEHLNFFDTKCFTRLLHYNGFTVKKIATTKSHFPWLGSSVINCCAILSSSDNKITSCQIA